MTQNRPCSDSLPAQTMHNGFHNTAALIMAQLVGFNYSRKRKGPKTGGYIAILSRGIITKGWIWTGKKGQRKEGMDCRRTVSGHTSIARPTSDQKWRESWKISLPFLGLGFQMAGMNGGFMRRGRKPESNEDQRGSFHLRKPLSTSI